MPEMSAMTLSVDTLSFICGASLCLGILVLIPITIISLFKYIHQSTKTKNKFFQARQPSLVIGTNILSMLIILIERPFLAFYNVFGFSSQLSNTVGNWSFDLIHCLCWFALLMAFWVKFFLLHFNQRLNLAIINQTWQQQINAGITDWYIVNQNRWGNASWLVKRLCLPLYICLVAFAVLEDIFMTQAWLNSLEIINGVIQATCVIMGLYIRYQTRYLSDIYGVRREMTFQTLIIFCYFIISLLFVVLHETNSVIYDNRVIGTLSIVSSLLLLCLVTVSSIIYPLRLYKAQLLPKPHGKIHVSTLMGSKFGGESLSQLKPLTSKEKSKQAKKERKELKQIEKEKMKKEKEIKKRSEFKHTLDGVLSDEMGFRLFMEHLASEFSSENLLFLVELVQIKQEYQNAHGNVLRLPRQVTLPPEMKMIGSEYELYGDNEHSNSDHETHSYDENDSTNENDTDKKHNNNDINDNHENNSKKNHLSNNSNDYVNQAVISTMNSLRNDGKYMTVDFDQLNIDNPGRGSKDLKNYRGNRRNSKASKNNKNDKSKSSSDSHNYHNNKDGSTSKSPTSNSNHMNPSQSTDTSTGNGNTTNNNQQSKHSRKSSKRKSFKESVGTFIPDKLPIMVQKSSMKDARISNITYKTKADESLSSISRPSLKKHKSNKSDNSNNSKHKSDVSTSRDHDVQLKSPNNNNNIIGNDDNMHSPSNESGNNNNNNNNTHSAQTIYNNHFMFNNKQLSFSGDDANLRRLFTSMHQLSLANDPNAVLPEDIERNESLNQALPNFGFNWGNDDRKQSKSAATTLRGAQLAELAVTTKQRNDEKRAATMRVEKEMVNDIRIEMEDIMDESHLIDCIDSKQNDASQSGQSKASKKRSQNEENKEIKQEKKGKERQNEEKSKSQEKEKEKESDIHFVATFSEYEETLVPTLRTTNDILDTMKVDKHGMVHGKQITYLFGQSGKICRKIELPHGLPVSRLLLANDNLFDRMEALYIKYIKPGCMFEINISSQMRHFLNEFFVKPREQFSSKFGLTMTGDFIRSHDNGKGEAPIHAVDQLTGVMTNDASGSNDTTDGNDANDATHEAGKKKTISEKIRIQSGSGTVTVTVNSPDAGSVNGNDEHHLRMEMSPTLDDGEERPNYEKIPSHDNQFNLNNHINLKHSTSSYLKRLNRLAFNVFDQAAIELLNLMHDAFMRFIRTKQFEKYIESTKKRHSQSAKVNQNKIDK